MRISLLSKSINAIVPHHVSDNHESYKCFTWGTSHGERGTVTILGKLYQHSPSPQLLHRVLLSGKYRLTYRQLTLVCMNRYLRYLTVASTRKVQLLVQLPTKINRCPIRFQTTTTSVTCAAPERQAPTTVNFICCPHVSSSTHIMIVACYRTLSLRSISVWLSHLDNTQVRVRRGPWNWRKQKNDQDMLQR